MPLSALTTLRAHNYLQKNKPHWLAKVQHLQALQEKIMPLLPATFKNYCQVANLENGCLTFVVANGSAATQLRFYSATLLTQFKNDPALQHIRKISSKVCPMQSTPRHPERQRKPMAALSPTTALVVAEIATSIADATLSQIMQRIAGHIRK